MEYTVFDIKKNENKIECLSYIKIKNKKITKKGSISNFIESFFNKEEILVSHYIVREKIPFLEKNLSIKIKNKLIDTLAISWYLFPIQGFKHELKDWALRLNKTTNLDINAELFLIQLNYCSVLYENKKENLFNYLVFKMNCLKEQEKNGITINVNLLNNLKNKTKNDKSKIAQQRFKVLNSFNENKVHSKAHGFTNTLRLKHSKPIVNLPSVNTYMGYEIRSLLTVKDENYILGKVDINTLEDKTKQHFIYFFDPKYVEELKSSTLDSHIEIAILSGLLTKEEYDFFKNFKDNMDKKKYEEINEKRKKAKQLNFAMTYGAGINKISSILNCDIDFAKKIYSIFWKKNKFLKEISHSCKTKETSFNFHENKFQKWIYNPVSGFWIFLRSEKNKFTNLNQSTGVFFFDYLLKITKEKLKNIPIIMQYHDEFLFVCKKKEKEQVEFLLKESIKEVNDKLKLNVKINISILWGNNYGDL